MTNKELYFFNKAKEISKLSDFKSIHIGSCAVYKNNIISIGYNTYKSHPIQKKYDRYRILYTNKGVEPKHTLHAEISCLNNIKDLNIKWSKIHLYVYRDDLNGNKANCRPCPSCMTFIKKLGIKTIYYTTNEGYVKEEIL